MRKGLYLLASLLMCSMAFAQKEEWRYALVGVAGDHWTIEKGTASVIVSGKDITINLYDIKGKPTKDSPYNEYFCMKLAGVVGLKVPDVDIIEGEYPLYIVRRFDRIEVDGVVKRIHQQDFCQARGITSAKKYESILPSGFIFITSPGARSRTKSAPIASNATDSEAITQPSFNLPRLKDQIPKGSLMPKRVLSLVKNMRLYEP